MIPSAPPAPVECSEVRLHDSPVAVVPVRRASNDIVDGVRESFQLPGLVAIDVGNEESSQSLVLRKCIELFETLPGIAQVAGSIPTLIGIESNQNSLGFRDTEMSFEHLIEPRIAI